MNAAVITISTSRAAGVGHDDSGDRLLELVDKLGLEVAGREMITDDRPTIEEHLRHWADVERCALVLTSGGTGMAPNDVTPEATRAVLDREAPGIAEAMRQASRPHTRHWMLSRAVAGIRGNTLIINLPGNPKSIVEVGEELAATLPHALALIAGKHPAHD